MVRTSGKVRKAESNVPGRCAEAAWGPAGEGPPPTAGRLASAGAPLASVRKFFLLSSSMQKGAGGMERASTSEFCGLIAGLVLVLEVTCNSSGKTCVMSLRRSSFPKGTPSAVSLVKAGRHF